MLHEKLEVLDKDKEQFANVPLADLKDYMLDVVEQHIERRLQSRRLLEESFEPLH